MPARRSFPHTNTNVSPRAKIRSERQQNRADDHHAFHADAKPGDLAGQLGTRALSSSKKFSATSVMANEVFSDVFGPSLRPAW